MQTVESDNMHSAGYDHDARSLHVRFKSGGHYSYADVPPSIHEGLMKAPSKTTYLRAMVIGKYQHTKINVDAS